MGDELCAKGWIEEGSTSVSGFSAKGHQGVFVQLAGLVVGRLEDGCAAHGSFGCGDDGKVLARDS